ARSGGPCRTGPRPVTGMAGKTGPSRRTASGRMAELVETIGPPISSVPWSPNFVAQTLEVLPVGLRDGTLFWMKPMHAESLRVGMPTSAKPAEVVLEVLKWYPDRKSTRLNSSHG